MMSAASWQRDMEFRRVYGAAPCRFRTGTKNLQDVDGVDEAGGRVVLFDDPDGMTAEKCRQKGAQPVKRVIFQKLPQLQKIVSSPDRRRRVRGKSAVLGCKVGKETFGVR